MQDILSLPAPPADAKLAYGSDSNQFGELRLPKERKGPLPVLCNIHGGYWRARYDLAHAGNFCAAFAEHGFAAWNLEYRRVGNPGGGWPGSFEDVLAGFKYIASMAKKYNLDLSRIVVTGHSAGGQLALVLGSRAGTLRNLGLRLRAVVPLAPVADMRMAHQLKLSADAAAEFLGGPPEQQPDHWKEADPMLLSVKVPQRLIHGLADDVVPLEESQSYLVAKKKRTEDVELTTIKGADHFDLIDPRTEAWKQVLTTVQQLI